MGSLAAPGRYGARAFVRLTPTPGARRTRAAIVNGPPKPSRADVGRMPGLTDRAAGCVTGLIRLHVEARYRQARIAICEAISGATGCLCGAGAWVSR